MGILAVGGLRADLGGVNNEYTRFNVWKMDRTHSGRNMVSVPSSFQCPSLICPKASSMSDGLRDLFVLSLIYLSFLAPKQFFLLNVKSRRP